MSGSMPEALDQSLYVGNPSTLLCMELGPPHEGGLGRPPDINLPLLSEISPSSDQRISSKEIDVFEADSLFSQVDSSACDPRPKCRQRMKRSDIIWGAWFFFTHYVKPALKKRREGMTLVEDQEFDRSDLRIDLFLVQHDLENLYMWVFKEKPENSFGKMQLRSYMNGHQRFEERQFPYRAEKGFARSHRMQRKHYRGLSNPQCIHGIEVIRSPSLAFVNQMEKKRWGELTGRKWNFSLPQDAESFSEWRSLATKTIDHLDGLGLPLPRNSSDATIKMLSSSRLCAKISGSNLKLSTSFNASRRLQVRPGTQIKKRKIDLCREVESDRPILSFSNKFTYLENDQDLRELWLSSFSGVMNEAFGPVTGAKTIYEDEDGYLIMVSLPFTDMQRLRVSWRNAATHGVVKIHCSSTAAGPLVIRGERTFKLTDPHPEHCPPGEFVREIDLATKIPEDAELKAFYVEAIAGLEIMVPKHHRFSKEREVRVFFSSPIGPQ